MPSTWSFLGKQMVPVYPKELKALIKKIEMVVIKRINPAN